jgi:hypothetical protein
VARGLAERVAGADRENRGAHAVADVHAGDCLQE